MNSIPVRGLWLLIFFMYSLAQINAQIIVDFDADTVEGCSSVSSQFYDKSSSTAGDIISWEWDLSDGKSDLQNPGKIFASIGSYDICLTVKDNKGNTDKKCKEKYINVYDLPKADFAVDVSSGCVPLNVTYSDLSTSPNGKITNWVWGLNGSNGIIKTSDTNREIFSNYNDPDNYTISLSITDEKGCIHSISKPNYIEVIEKPEVKVTTLEPIGCAFPMTVDFVNLGEEEQYEYTWDFGNGETYVGFDPLPIVYQNKGAYDIVVVAKNLRTSCTDTLVLYDYINTGGTILFDFYPKQVCRNGLVQFEDLSPVESEAWEWDFGDGNTSTERDPSHVYKLPGKYAVSLSRKTAECEGVQISQYQVEVLENPTFNFEIDKSNNCLLPAEVSFKTDYNDGSLYRWYIGDPIGYEAILKDQEATYEFEEYGSYEVRLLVDSKIGCRSFVLIDTIKLEPFKIDITGQTEGCIPFSTELGIASNSAAPLNNISWSIYGEDTIISEKENIYLDFDDVASYDVELIVENEIGCVDSIRGKDLIKGGIMPSVEFDLSDNEVCPKEIINFEDLSSENVNSWNWIFNDSTFSEVQHPEMSFSSPGEYTVQLHVGHNGCYNMLTKVDTFLVHSPKVAFDLEYNCDNPYRIKTINKSSEYDSLVWSYQVGNENVFIPYKDSLEISFPDKDIYVVSLQAFNYENGCENTASDTVWISDLKSKFSVSTNEGCSPLSLEFTDESTDAVSWKYITNVAAFSDDTIRNPTMRIHPPGEYNEIGLIVSDRHGCQDTSYADPIKVNKVYASFPTPAPVCANDTMNIINTSTSFFSSINKVKWVLGDQLDTSFLYDGQFVSKETGKHDLKLVVEDEWGCTDSTTTGLAAYFRAPNFELVADSLSCTTHEMQFRNLYHANNYQYEWDFGDGVKSNEATPSHLYTDEGSYQLSVLIKDDEACTNEIVLEQPIKIADPIASFIADSTFTSCPPLATTFTNNSLNSLNYIWNFGDESGTSGEVDPAHLYIKAGVFDVELIAVRSEYCQDTVLLSDLIQLEGPKGEFTFEIDSSCVPLNVNFEADLADDYLLIWDFGDGNLSTVNEGNNQSSISYTYEKAGEFIPKIILEDQKNCKITKEGESIVTQALEAKFTASDSIFCDEIINSIDFTDETFSTSQINSYYWLINGVEYEEKHPTHITSDTGRYDVSLIVENAYCADTLTKVKFINVGERPRLIPLRDTFNCVNTSITLNVESEDQEDRISWFNSAGNRVATGLYYELSNLNQSQDIIVKAQNEYSCTDLDTINVELIDDRTPFAGPDKTICFGSDLDLEIEYGSNIFWTNVPECSNCSKLSLSPDTISSYYVEVTNDYGCIVRDTLTVDVLYQDDIDAGEDQNVCISERPVLLAFVEGDVKWSPGALVDSPNDYLTAANITESTLFYLESTKDECTLKDSVYINILQKAKLEAVGDTVCFGETSQLFASGYIDQVRWETKESMISNPEIINPVSHTRESTRFMAIGSLGGCEPDTAFADVMVYPEINGHLPSVRQYFQGTEEVEIALEMFSSGNYEYIWYPSELVDCANCPSVMIKTQDSSQYVSVEILEKDSGCSDTLSVTLREFNGCESAVSGIGVPNIFSPNGDGINDVLNIECPAFDDIESLAIYDQWGQKVFHSNSIVDSWNGKLDGVPVQSGVYAYVLQAACPETGEFVQKVGDVTVIR